MTDELPVVSMGEVFNGLFLDWNAGVVALAFARGPTVTNGPQLSCFLAHNALSIRFSVHCQTIEQPGNAAGSVWCVCYFFAALSGANSLVLSGAILISPSLPRFNARLIVWLAAGI